jgi:hypothetical protein
MFPTPLPDPFLDLRDANGMGVIINSSGQLGTILSSARFKEQIKPMDKGVKRSYRSNR